MANNHNDLRPLFLSMFYLVLLCVSGQRETLKFLFCISFFSNNTDRNECYFS